MEKTRGELQVHQVNWERQNEELQQAQARADTLLAQYTDLYDFAPTGYLTLDREGTIRQVNLTGARMLGVERPRLVNQHFEQYVAEKDRSTLSAFLERLFASEATESCEVTLPQEGSLPLAVRIEARRSPGAAECRAAALDISERRQAEEQARAATAEAQRLLLASDQSRRALLSAAEDEREAASALRTLYAELEQRVRERTAQLAAANQELEAFSYSVSHDLRAPLRAIDGFSRIVQEDYAAKLDDEGRDSLARIRAAAQRMAQLIDDLLKLSRLSRADLNRQPVDLSALARDVVAELQQRDPARTVEMVVTDGLTAQGDPHLLRVVLENLLGNAWKFTGRRDSARIEFGAETQNGRPVWFVRDNGAGFDATHADKLFSPFQRLHTREEFAGTGIGLATVQRIVRRHGGRVWAEGTVDQGATLWFDLGSEEEFKRNDT